MKLYRNMRRNG